MVAKKHRNTAEAANPNAVKRRPSFEIANDFVELNFKPIIEVEAEESLSKAELKAKRKQERRERKQRHLLRNSIIAVICLVVVAGTTATIWWNSSNEHFDLFSSKERILVPLPAAKIIEFNFIIFTSPLFYKFYNAQLCNLIYRNEPRLF